MPKGPLAGETHGKKALNTINFIEPQALSEQSSKRL
jgi:hypothetical protein